ncbi:MAG: hypothetical protein ACJ8DI_08365 [Ktedonobacteraceae bacterium]
MPKDTERYQYFTVGLERDSWALERFKADAKKHHMSDQPGKLIALRLTEYYELLERGALHALASVPLSEASGSNGNRHKVLSTREQQPVEDEVIAVSEDAEQNADEAADYWSTL